MTSFDTFISAYLSSWENLEANNAALRQGFENLRGNRWALRVCLNFLSRNDFLYTPVVPWAGFDLDVDILPDHGNSPEYFALELALGLHPWLPIAPLATTILGIQYTVQELVDLVLGEVYR